MAANVNNYISAGQAAVNSAVKSRKALARNKPRFDDLGTEAIKQAGLENEAAFAANAKASKAGINAMANVQDTRNDINAAKEIQGIKKGARKAGMLAGGVAMLGVGATLMNKKDEPDEMLALYKGQLDKYGNKIGEADSKITEAQAHLDSFKNKPKPSDTTTDTTSTTTPVSTGAKPAGGSKTGVRLAKDLMAQGYSKTQAAAIAGNAQHESADFTAHEEFAPNSYGTKGVGYLQWTNTNTKRRDQFQAFAKDNNLDPKSHDASSRYMAHEMNITGKDGHWTGSGRAGFMEAGDLTSATTRFMDNFLRPAKEHAHLDRRLNNAQSIYSQL